MLRETGRVIAVDGDYATVSSSRGSGCGSCHAEGSCTVLSGGINRKVVEITAYNQAGAAVGEAVVVELNEGTLLRASFLVYILPVMALMVVAALLSSELPAWGVAPELVDPLSAGCGFGAMGVVFLVLRGGLGRNRWGVTHPVVTEVVYGGEPFLPSGCQQ